MHTSLYQVRDSFGEYQSVPAKTAFALVRAGVTRMEGVDGDEEANTVTYYYAENEEI